MDTNKGCDHWQTESVLFTETGTQRACLHSGRSLSMKNSTKEIGPELTGVNSVDTEESSLWSDFSDKDIENSGGEFAALEPLKDCLIREILVSFAVSKLSHIPQPDWCVADSGGSKSTRRRSQKSSSNSGKCITSQQSSRFRKGSGNTSEDGSKEDDLRPGKRRKTTSDEQKEERFLACPFCKNNPQRYLSCYRYIIRNISRLK